MQVKLTKPIQCLNNHIHREGEIFKLKGKSSDTLGRHLIYASSLDGTETLVLFHGEAVIIDELPGPEKEEPKKKIEE